MIAPWPNALSYSAVIVAVGLVFGAPSARAEPPPLTIADLNGYRDALAGKPGGVAISVTFRELWSQPAAYQGKRVAVRGRIARVFQQGAYGTFPDLTEAWLVSAAGDPTCVVYATRPSGPNVGDEVTFTGTFLRVIPYAGGDVRRLAPLIVGDALPVKAVPSQRRPAAAGSEPLEWAIGLLIAGMVVMMFARQYLRSPVTRVQGIEPAPRFTDERSPDASDDCPQTGM